MKGSYSVPTGSSRSPLIECESPSADSRMNRFISAMPSSICWPCGENSQLKVEGMRSLLKVSAMASRANSPRRLTQGPRLVETVTSGEVVTMRRGEVVVAAADLVEDGAEAGLRRRHRLHAAPGVRPAPRCAAPSAGAARLARTARRRGMPANVQPVRSVPRTCPIRAPAAHSLALLEDVHLRRRHQPGVIVLVAGERQAVALDGVGR